MLGTAVQLLGLRDLPPWMQVLGDQEFLRTLGTLASNLESLCSHIQPQIPLPKRARWRELVQALWSVDSPVQEMIVRIVEWILPHALQADHLNVDDLDVLHRRAHAARNLLARLNARRFPKLAYRLRTAHHTGGENDETIAAKYCNPKERYALERRIEDVCNLPMGSVVVHCPRRKTSMKVAEVLVVGRDLTRAAHLRNVTTVSQEGLEPYEREIKAIEDMYLSIWQLHAFVDLAHWDKQPLVEWAFERETKFPNDELLTEELAHEPRGTYHFLASDLRDEIPPKSLPEVVRRVDAEVTTRMRLSETEGHDLHTKLRQIIRSVLSTDTTDGRDQLDLPGFGPKE
jgi:hypothetical protein